ncbi:hypothetical protein J3R30DRAFT_1600823 [Lentinula aciculospora]|uniref:Uncharacterized protein n=1 Tax=Lentinula aciculospora TaxID=153920 RepID=A0A9W9DFZ4_9AGAR|nr:hypothetical protein J3R30DRAFT_1600823 [Lentinula aciculospora]
MQHQEIGSVSPSSRLPEIPLLSSFHCSSFVLETPTNEEQDKIDGGPHAYSTGAVSSDLNSSHSSSLVIVPRTTDNPVEQVISLSNRDAQARSNPSGKEELDTAEVSSTVTKRTHNASDESLDVAEVDGLLKHRKSSSSFNSYTTASNDFQCSISTTVDPSHPSTQTFQSVDISNTSSNFETSFFTASSSIPSSIFELSPKSGPSPPLVTPRSPFDG